MDYPSTKIKKRVVDINHYHVSLSHAHSSVLKATAQQHGIQLIGELAPCSGCSMAKGIRASTPHRTTSRAETPLDLVHIDTAGPFPESLGGSRYVVMFVDSASRFQRPYGTRDKSASAILGVVQRFVADMGVPRAFRTDNGTEYTNSAFVEYCNGLQIRRELTAPYTPQQNGPVESGLSRAIKAGHAARIEVNRLFPDVHLDKLKGVRDPDGTGLWMESVLWASEGFNRSATTANAGMLSPHEIFFGSRPPMPILPFCQPAYHRIPRHGKLERQARLCYFLNFGHNHGRDCIKILERGCTSTLSFPVAKLGGFLFVFYALFFCFPKLLIYPGETYQQAERRGSWTPIKSLMYATGGQALSRLLPQRLSSGCVHQRLDWRPRPASLSLLISFTWIDQ